MLLQFMVANFRSFKDETLLNLVPAKSRIHPDHILTDEAAGKRVQAVPFAAIYGANASGKSNLIKALAFAQELIVKGTRGEDSIPVIPFRLDVKTSEAPARFEFVLKHEGVLYTYGFVVSSHVVQEEWLFAVVKSQEIRLFERVTSEGKAHVEIGDHLAKTGKEKQRLEFVAEGTRPNQLFLTEANERNVTELKPIMQWFQTKLKIISPESFYSTLTLRAESDKEFMEYLARLLQLADTGIEDISVNAEPLDLERLFPDLPEDDRKLLRDALTDAEMGSVSTTYGKGFFAIRRQAKDEPLLLTLKTRHQCKGMKSVDFNTREESDGTQRLMHLAPILFGAWKTNAVFIVDELDRSMHPLLCRFVVEAFLKGVTENKAGSQLLVTTHETNLLDLDLLRRDEIWFVEKDKGGGSHLGSLSDYKLVRSDLKLSKGYLNGRFGAIPFIGDARKLVR